MIRDFLLYNFWGGVTVLVVGFVIVPLVLIVVGTHMDDIRLWLLGRSRRNTRRCHERLGELQFLTWEIAALKTLAANKVAGASERLEKARKQERGCAEWLVRHGVDNPRDRMKSLRDSGWIGSLRERYGCRFFYSF